MKKRSFHPLGEAEMELLQHVWDLKRANVAQVHQRVLQTREVAYTTVMTVLKKLADKGYLRYEKQGNAYVYSPAEAPDAVRLETDELDPGAVLERLLELALERGFVRP